MTTPDMKFAEPSRDAGIPRRSGAGPAPLSFAQELLWLMDRASPGTSVWNVPRAFRVRGPLDVGALQRSLAAVCARHEVLRTVFEATADGPCQVVRDGAFELTPIDLSRYDAADCAARCERLIRDEAERPFDLGHDLLLRGVLVTLAPDDRVLCLTSHHIVSDGWSKSVLFRELSALYEGFAAGRTPELPALPVQFGDYAAWERAPAREATVAGDLAYWSAQLGLLPALELPTDSPRAADPSYEGARSVVVLPQTLIDGVAALGRAHGVTLYMTLLAAYATLLHRYGGQDDFAIGSPMAARAHAETEDLIGYLTNTLVVRCRLHGDPAFAGLLGRIRDTCLEAYEHQEIPFEHVVLELQKGRQLSPAPFFQALLTMEDTLPATLRLGAATVEPIEAERGKVKVDLTLLAARVPGGLRLALWYRCELFAPATAERMLGHLQTLLESAVASPGTPLGELRMLASAEEAELRRANATSQRFSGTSVVERFLRAARRRPGAVAVVCGDARLSYAELAARTGVLAAQLRELGAGRGSFVGLALERSCDFAVGLLGIARAGAAYVPLAPDLPAARLALQVAESGVRIVVTHAANRQSFGPSIECVCLDGPERPQRAASAASFGEASVAAADPAYVVFTSGSTGIPKGVVVTHGNLANYVDALGTLLDLAADEPLSFAFTSSAAADLGNTALFPALCSGGALHVIPPEPARDGAAFAALMAASPVDVLKITPSHLRALLEAQAGGAGLPRRWLVLGGEACPWDLIREVRSRATCRIVNHYGPTEATVGATAFVLNEDASGDPAAGCVPIGRPLANVTCYVLDERRQVLPVGIPGELYVGGLGVAAGYLNAPDATAERFLPDLFTERAGARLYRTGDRVRRLPSGDLEFLGRRDHQVKVRGFRVELGEIESVLAACSGVSQSVVILREDAATGAQLVAYVVAPGVPEAVMRTWLEARLPEYMLPAAIVSLERFPLSPNGKLDRAALAPGNARSPAVPFVAPRTATEEAIAAIWAEVLQRDPVSVTGDFLTLGFHSILAIRALGHVSRSLGVRLPLRALFEAPTIAQLAVIVDVQLARMRDIELERALDLLDGLPPTGNG